MKTFSTTTLGCKVNQYESQQVRQLLEELGLTQTPPTQQPDLLVINTCCITHTASAKSRQSIRKSQKLNPHSAIVVTGCLTAVQLDEMNDITTANLNIVSNHQSLADTLRRIVQSQTADSDPGISQSQDNHRIIAYNQTKIKLKNDLSNLSHLPSLTSYKGHTRAFLKVQDGCDSCCSYCIVPKTRPLIHSKDHDSVLAEATRLADIGHKEIVITGVNLGAYNQNTTRRKNWASPENDQLPILLDRLAQIENLKRIRISSLAPADVTDLLIETIAKHPNIMPHLHLSLQSGSDSTLKRMCRHYTTEDFLKTVEKIKKIIAFPAITSDIIVGFPGETDKDFQKTIDLAKKVAFAKIHVFAFSARKGTAAAVMPGALNSSVIKERSKILRDLDCRLGYEFRQQFVGSTAEILIEDAKNTVQGRTERYFMVQLKKKPKSIKKNDLIKVKLVKNSKTIMLAEYEI